MADYQNILDEPMSDEAGLKYLNSTLKDTSKPNNVQQIKAAVTSINTPKQATSTQPTSSSGLADFGGAVTHKLGSSLDSLANMIEGGLAYGAKQLPQNALTDYIISSAEADKKAQDIAEQKYQATQPKSSGTTAGEIVGEAIPFALGEGAIVKGAEKLAPAAIGAYRAAKGKNALTSLMGATTEGAAGGAAQNVLMPQDQDLTTTERAKEGAKIGAMGGVLGKAVSSAANPLISKAQKVLKDAGVDLTSGQLLGGSLKGIEDSLTHIPFLGDQIKEAKKNASETFVKAAMSKVLTPINETVETQSKTIPELAGHIQKVISDKYDSIVPNLSGKVDRTFRVDMGKLINQDLQNVSEPAKATFNSFVQNNLGSGRFSQTGEFTGQSAQRIWQDINKKLEQYKTGTSGADKETYQLFKDLKDSFSGLLERQNTPASKEFKAANAAYQRSVAVMDALDKAKNNEHVFTPNQLNNALAGLDTSRKNARYTTGNVPYKDMKELAQAGSKVLPSKVGDSGTASRTMMNDLLKIAGAGATGYGINEMAGNEHTAENVLIPAALIGAGSAAYSKTGQNALNALLTKRPELLRSLAPYLDSLTKTATVSTATKAKSELRKDSKK